MATVVVKENFFVPAATALLPIGRTDNVTEARTFTEQHDDTGNDLRQCETGEDEEL